MKGACTLCDALQVLKSNPAAVAEHGVFVSGVALGILIDRISTHIKKDVSEMLCSEHLELVLLITDTSVSKYPELAPFLKLTGDKPLAEQTTKGGADE